MPYPKPRPSKHSLKVKRGLAGLGLFAETPIKRKDFVIEYWGTLLRDTEANEKGGKYLFDIGDTPWTIDGTTRANLARYINHSCKPNCEAIQEGKRVFLYATRAIKPGEELSYDYGKEYFKDMIGGECRCGNH
jgi:SET domain-containing protein